MIIPPSTGSGRLTSWVRPVRAADDTSAVMIWGEPSKQGYAFRTYGNDRRTAVMVDGIWLVMCGSAP